MPLLGQLASKKLDLSYKYFLTEGLDGKIARATYLDARGHLKGAYFGVVEFDDIVIEYVTRDGESNGALFRKIGFKKPVSML